MPAKRRGALLRATDTLTAAQRYQAGKALRVRVPRSTLAEWAPAAGRHDPIQLLIESNRTRVPELVPIRYGRMATSPFAFLRGCFAHGSRSQWSPHHRY